MTVTQWMLVAVALCVAVRMYIAHRDGDWIDFLGWVGALIMGIGLGVTLVLEAAT